MAEYALVTGASRGIGRAIAEMLAKEGCNLYLTCLHSKDMLDAYGQELSARYTVSCKTFLADMGKEEDVSCVFSEIPELTILVNNAGISYFGLLSEMSSDDWHKIISTNLDSVFYTCRLAIPLMLQTHRGRIINISSVWGNVGASMETAYSASKGGVNALTKAIAKELAPSNIQVNAIACGVIDTDMNHRLAPEDIDRLREEIPADRIGQPSEVAALVKNLLYAPDYLTGQIIALDGGWQ